MVIQAVCTDCTWSFRDEDPATVSDALERHALKELHSVEYRRESVKLVE